MEWSKKCIEKMQAFLLFNYPTPNELNACKNYEIALCTTEPHDLQMTPSVPRALVLITVWWERSIFSILMHLEDKNTFFMDKF